MNRFTGFTAGSVSTHTQNTQTRHVKLESCHTDVNRSIRRDVVKTRYQDCSPECYRKPSVSDLKLMKPHLSGDVLSLNTAILIQGRGLND